MANLPENAVYEPGIFQLEKTTPPLGGVPVYNGNTPSDGHANIQAQQLANRTSYLKAITDDLDQRLTDVVSVSAGIYPDVDAGVAATANGGYFNVPSTDPNEYIILYQNVGGTAVEISRSPSSGRVDSVDADLQQTKATVDSLQSSVDTTSTRITEVENNLTLIDAEVDQVSSDLVQTNLRVDELNTDLQATKDELEAEINEFKTEVDDTFYRTSNKLTGDGDLVLDSQSGQSISSLSLNNPAAAVWLVADQDKLVANTRLNRLEVGFDLTRKVDILDVTEGHSDKREYPEFQTLSDSQTALVLGTNAGNIGLQIDTISKKITTEFNFESSIEQRPPTLFVDTPARIERNTASPTYRLSNRVYQATATIARTGTRYWTAWRADNTTAGEAPGNFAVLAYSDNNCASVTEYGYLTYLPGFPGNQIIDPMLWTDPDGRLWLFYGVIGNNRHYDGVGGSWAVICQNPTAQFPVWGEPFRLSYFGDPRRPVQVNGKWYIALDGWRFSAEEPPRYMEYVGPHIHEIDWRNQKLKHISQLPPNNNGQYSGFFETEFVQRSDGSVLALLRWQGESSQILYSVSTDLMRTWTPWADYTTAAPSSSSRMWLGRTPSGRILLCWNNDTIRRTLTVGLSDDDGATYSYKKIIEPDTTIQVSYPIVAFGDNGDIFVIYDNGRITQRQIRVSRVNEQQIVAGTSTPVVTVISNPLA